MKTDPHRKALLAKAHIGKKALGLDDATWTLLVQRVTGQVSCRDARTAQLALLIDELVRLGFKDAPVRPSAPSAKKMSYSDRPQVRMVFGQWAELGRMGALTDPGKTALRAFCGNQVKGGVSTDPEFLTGAELRQVIEALKSWIARAKSKSEPPRRQDAKEGAA